MLPEYNTVDKIEGETGHESESQAAGPRRLDAPVKHHQHEKVRAQRFQHGG